MLLLIMIGIWLCMAHFTLRRGCKQCMHTCMQPAQGLSANKQPTRKA